MNEVIELKVVEDFIVWLKFSDGDEKLVNLKPYLGKGFTKELLDPTNFNKLFVEPGGGIAWENGYDFCPNFLKELQDIRHKV